MSLNKENNFVLQFKFDCLASVILMQVRLFRKPIFLSFTASTALLMEPVVPVLSFSISHLRVTKTSRPYKIRFLILDAQKSLSCSMSEIRQPSTYLNTPAYRGIETFGSDETHDIQYML
jgi:hypothetical protein